MFNLLRRNGRRYGGYIVHLAIVLIGVAIVGNEFYQTTTNVTLTPGQSVTLSGYELTYTGMDFVENANHIERNANLMVFREDTGKLLGTITPRNNYYPKTPDMPTSEVGLRMSPVEDVYVVLNGWENNGTSATFTIYVNPLTIWMWVGGLVLVLGVLFAMWPHPVHRRQTQALPSLGRNVGAAAD